MENLLSFEDSQAICNRVCNQLDLEHQSKMAVLVEQEELNLFTMLKPSLTLDGDMWCVLVGENLQEGICGFGKSPLLAIYEFNKNFRTATPTNLKGGDEK